MKLFFLKNCKGDLQRVNQNVLCTPSFRSHYYWFVAFVVMGEKQKM